MGKAMVDITARTWALKALSGGGGGTPAGLTAINNQRISVKAAGYDAYGDNTHNDTAAINAAMAYAASIGVGVLFPAGRYLITAGALSIPANMTLEGIGDARLCTKETAIYNIMAVCHADNIRWINMGFDQTGDSALTPTGVLGCHILHYNAFDTMEVRDCQFYGYGITQILTQPNDGYGNKIIVTDCKFYWSKKADAIYDVSVVNLDGINVVCTNNEVIATNAGGIAEWMPETAYEVHMPAGIVFNNEATRVKNGVIHVQAPMQYATFPDNLVRGGVQITHNRFFKCLGGVSCWGANTIAGVISRNLIIKDNYHNAHVGGNGGGLTSGFKPTTSIELRDGMVDGAFFKNVQISGNISEYTKTSYVSGANQLTFTTTTVTTTGLDFKDFTIGDYIKISGCTVNAGNNVTAKRITGVSAKTLTFAAATFTAGAETVAITIQIDIDNWLGGGIAYTYCGAIKGITDNGIEDLDVFGNTIISWPFAAFTFVGTTTQHKRIRIYDNRTVDCAYMQPSTATYHGLCNFNNCAGVEIKRNKFIKGGVTNKTPLKTLYLGATALTGLVFLDNDVSTLTAVDAAYETNDTILKTMITDTAAFLALGCKPNITASGAGTALPATTGTISVTMDGSLKTLVPTGACTLNATGGNIGQTCTFVITTSGTTTYNITFGTAFKSNGVLATGAVTAKVFTITFIYDGTNWNEIGARGTAM